LRPGAVSREELEAILGEVPLATTVANESVPGGWDGPGMTVKHYAPRATVEVCASDEELRVRADDLRSQGKQVGFLTVTDDIVRLAHTLFSQFRSLDAQGVDVILCVLPEPQGLGLAVRDRLLRAAGKGGRNE